MIKERPILFSGPMVKAILEGRKTQTRRVVKAKHLPFLENILNGFLDVKWNQRPMPYGQSGDRLWVRETWATAPNFDAVRPSALPRGISIVRRADNGATGGHWRPSIHMPRWASRIMLEIMGVRVERLWEITEMDARAEGLDGAAAMSLDPYDLSAQERFQGLWNSLHAKDGAGWDANPWVWVIEFKRLS